MISKLTVLCSLLMLCSCASPILPKAPSLPIQKSKSVTAKIIRSSAKVAKAASIVDTAQIRVTAVRDFIATDNKESAQRELAMLGADLSSVKEKLAETQDDLVFAKSESETVTVEMTTAKKEFEVFVEAAQKVQKERDDMKVRLAQIDSYWGLGAIVYGVKKLALRLAIIGLGLVALSVVAAVAFPASGVGSLAAKLVFGIPNLIKDWIAKIRKPKNTTQ